MPKCGFVLISIKIARIRTPRYACFMLYNLPAWLNTCFDGTNVAVIPRNSRAVAPQIRGASSLEKRVCCGRAAFDINFQHETTFSLMTGNRPMNFAICPSLIYYRKFSVLFLRMRSPPTASSSAQYSYHSTIVPTNRYMT